jgi:hypothetical protein
MWRLRLRQPQGCPEGRTSPRTNQRDRVRLSVELLNLFEALLLKCTPFDFALTCSAHDVKLPNLRDWNNFIAANDVLPFSIRPEKVCLETFFREIRENTRELCRLRFECEQDVMKWHRLFDC